jgi:tetratricopeptide (TPR) repeat protein
MLETIREYAAERPDDAADLRRRHAERFVEVAERARAGMLEGGEAEAVAFALLDEEAENLAAALEWADATSSIELEARIAVALRWYWLVRGRLGEGTRVFERIAVASEDLPAVHADAMSGAGVFNYRRGDRARAVRQFEVARDLYATLGNDDEEARCLAELGGIAVDDGELARAAELFAAAVVVFERIGNVYRLGAVLANLAAIATLQGDDDAAARYSGRAIALQRESNDLTGLGVSLANYGRVQLKAGDLDAARVTLAEAFDLALKLDYRMLIAYLLGSVGDLAAAAGDEEGAVRYVGAAAGLFESIGMPVPPEEVDEHERTLGSIRTSLGAATVEQLLRQGRDAPADQLIESARALI